MSADEPKEHRQKTKADTAKRFREVLDERKRLKVENEQLQARNQQLESELESMRAKIPKQQPQLAPDEWYLGWSSQHLGRRNV